MAEQTMLTLEQEPYKLPEGWKWARLGDIAEVLYGKGLPKRNRKTGVYGVYGSGGLIDKCDKYLIDYSTIIIGRKGSIGAVTLVMEECWPIDTVFYLKLKDMEKIDLKYLYFALKRTNLASLAIITAVPGINREDLERVKIPLPPLEEQKRIVARIEELVSKVEEAKKLRKQAREETERIMQAALHKVFSRAEEEGWELVKLGNVCEIIMGQSPPSDTYNEEGVGLPFFQGKIEFGEVYPTPKKWCSRPVKIAKPNDVLIAVRAPVGPTNLCREECCVGRGLAALRPNQNKSSYWFLLYVLRYFEPKITQIGKGSTFGAITKKDLIALEIPLPPLEEQKRIVAYLDKIRETAESLKKLQGETEKELAKLVPAILNKALRGEL